MINYPIRFETILKEKIWGGDKLKNSFGKTSDLKILGESWEISGVKDNISVVKNGILKGQTLNSIVEKYKFQVLGKSIYKKFGTEFPLLIKFIDAKKELSVQLHLTTTLPGSGTILSEKLKCGYHTGRRRNRD